MHFLHIFQLSKATYSFLVPPLHLPSPCCLISQSTWSLTFPFSFPCELQLKSWPWHSSKVPSPISLPAPALPPPAPAHSHLHSHQSGSHRHEHCRQDAQIFIGSREFFISTVAGSQAGGCARGVGVCLCVCVCVWVCARVASATYSGWFAHSAGSRAASPRLALLRVACLVHVQLLSLLLFAFVSRQIANDKP